MSKPFSPEHFSGFSTPKARVADFATRYSPLVTEQSLEFIQYRATELGLSFTPDETKIIAALNTPGKTQEFMDRELVYNNDHDETATEETAFSPKSVMQNGAAHCFEGATFAYVVAHLHGYNPQMILLESTQDIHHNVVVYQDKESGEYGSMAQSAYPGLNGKPARFSSIQELVEAYHPHYYSIRSNDPTDYSLIGYSEPIDLVARYGTSWMDTEEPLWDIYNSYINARVNFYRTFDDSGITHLYAMIRAVTNGWIEFKPDGSPIFCPENMPPDAFKLWQDFFGFHGENPNVPKGRAGAINLEFLQKYDTTPLDLHESVSELDQYLRSGNPLIRLFY